MAHKKVNIPLEGVYPFRNVKGPEHLKDEKKYRFKFIVINTRDVESQDGGKYLRGEVYDRFLGYHTDIAYSAKEQEGLEGYITGGWIQVHPRRKRIYAFGSSEKFGPASSIVVRQLLEEYCHNLGYELNVVMDDIRTHESGVREKGMEESLIKAIKEVEDNEERQRIIEYSKWEIERLEEDLEEYCMDKLKALIEEIES